MLSLRAGFGLSLILALAGCLQTTGGSGGAPVLRQAALAGGSVVVTPPPRYCIDANSLSDRPSGGFALIGSCATLTGEATGVFVEPAIITLSVSPAQADDMSIDSRAFQTALDRGRVIKAVSRDDLSLLQVEGGARVPPSADERHWRGLMRVGGQVVGLALYGAAEGPMSGDQGMRLLIELADAIQTQSAAAAQTAARAAAATPVAAPAQATTE